MPLPMVHLSVAVEYFEYGDVPPAFLLGSIAPDAIHMRKGTNREDKRRTHLNVENEPDLQAYMRNKYEHYISQSPDEPWKWFVKGYFAHLLTDYFWLLDVYSVFKARTGLDGLTKDEARKAYYRDTDQIDFTYYRTKPWVSEVWSGLIGARSFDVEPLLTAEEIHYWRFRTVHWFDLLGEEPGTEPRYITQPMVDAFIPAASRRIRGMFTAWDREVAETRAAGGGTSR
ncbi:zinc dependent phospholipase C family protein [Paenibacillus allorhizosphaerae]|uniref:Phospholipase C/D domain-containing protein n=1 Tax=Paenibacillus allorhizosphaerae TaxID=2849866 RepID=A0ABM8VP33_9BACL|nr:zinc dependent phospholipase C family protein [Paenibacillus allorhizosphaerae]CAG7652274.1 hypothetical protein PAECIP111802_05182 [Paenibacillus allorhizosphaerae]